MIVGLFFMGVILFHIFPQKENVSVGNEQAAKHEARNAFREDIVFIGLSGTMLLSKPKLNVSHSIRASRHVRIQAVTL